jgi:hypothetical protein
MVTAAGALGGALLLTAAAVGHLRYPRRLPAALRAQRLLRRRLSGPVAGAVVGSELLAGVAVLGGTLAVPSGAAVPLAAQALLYMAFTGYLWVVRRLRPAAPCGCFGAEPVTWLVVARSGLLAGVTVAAIAARAEIAALPAAFRPVCLAGGVVVAMAGWLLPAMTGHRVPTAAARRS